MRNFGSANHIHFHSVKAHQSLPTTINLNAFAKMQQRVEMALHGAFALAGAAGNAVFKRLERQYIRILDALHGVASRFGALFCDARPVVTSQQH